MYENIDQIVLNKLHGPMHYKIGVTCVYNGHVVCTLLQYHDSLIQFLLYTNIVQTLVSLLHGLLNCEIGVLDWHVITPQYRTRVH